MGFKVFNRQRLRVALDLAALLRAEGETVVNLGRVVPGEGVIYTGKLL